jgi:hypothetical protein
MSVCSFSDLSKDGDACSFTNIMFPVLFNDTTTVTVLGNIIWDIVEYGLWKWKMWSPVARLAWQNWGTRQNRRVSYLDLKLEISQWCKEVLLVINAHSRVWSSLLQKGCFPSLADKHSKRVTEREIYLWCAHLALCGWGVAELTSHTKGRLWTEADTGENYIMRSLMNCNPREVLL